MAHSELPGVKLSPELSAGGGTSRSPKILDGKTLSRAVGRTVAAEAARVTKKLGRAPGLAVILVGENPASKTYVASKHRFAKECGLVTFDAHLPASTTREELAEVIHGYNTNDLVDGILLQLPLPAPLDGSEFVCMIAPEKDADGLHPMNQGLLLQGAPAPRPCTPLGVMTMLDLALSNVTLSETTTLADLPAASLAGKKAVVLVAAVGVPRLVTKNFVKPGAIVLDVGINRLADGKLCGDVDYDDVAPVSSAITPVPGGVGPMTVAMLISNTLQNCKRNNGITA